MKKILMGYISSSGGVNTYIKNYISQLDSENQVFLIGSNVDSLTCMQFQKMGVKVYTICSLKKPVQQFQSIRNIIISNNIDVAYFNISEATNCVGVLAAKHAKVKEIVVHSHSSGVDVLNPLNRSIRGVLHRVARKIFFAGNNIIKVACSDKAAEWMFNNSNNVRIVHNAVDLSRFYYSKEIRDRIRRELKILDKFVIGFVGALSYQKNPLLMIDIFAELKKIKENVYLIMIGDGVLYDRVVEYAKEKNVYNEIKLFRNYRDMNAIYNALDVFIMTSKFEGLPYVSVESQATGCPNVLSKQITKQVDVSGNVEFVQLTDDVRTWVKFIMKNENFNRSDLTINRQYVLDK